MREFYEPKFYEVRALAHLARMLNCLIVANFRLPHFKLPPNERPEVDGYVEIDRKDWAIEVKSYPLSEVDIDKIAVRYESLGFEQLIVVAPLIKAYSLRMRSPKVELVTFKPDLSPIATYYKYHVLTDEWVQEELADGWYHFRYKLAERGEKKLAWALNQTDKRIRDGNELWREILHRVMPKVTPIRVYWSVNQWLSPKDLYFARRPNTLIKERVVFDIDGDQIHSPFFPCLINDQGMCEYCFRFAKQHTQRLIEFLNENGLYKLRVVFSGWRGFHVYVLDENIVTKQVNDLLRNAISRKIRIDRRVTLDYKGIIGLPGTLHGHSMKPLVTVVDLAHFTWDDVQRL